MSDIRESSPYNPCKNREHDVWLYKRIDSFQQKRPEIRVSFFGEDHATQKEKQWYMESINKSIAPITKPNVAPNYQEHAKGLGKVYIV